MDVSIVIVNWNSKEFLSDCIESVQQHTSGLEYEIIVIDSGSFDGSAELMRTRFAQFRFLQSAANLGFAGANNLAVEQARGEHLLFLNPDTRMLSPAVNLMLEHLRRHPRAGAVGVRLLNGDGSVQTSCIQAFPTLLSQTLNSEVLRAWFPRSSLWGTAPLYDSRMEPVRVDVVSGACLMLCRSAFEQVGGFCEDYFMYAEDLDLCHRLKRAGLQNYYLPQASVTHFGGGSTESAPSEFSVVMMQQSIWQFLRKSRGVAYAAAFRLCTLGAALLRLVLLAVLLPLAQLRGERVTRVVRRSSGKWRAVLGWSLGTRRAERPPPRADLLAPGVSSGP